MNEYEYEEVRGLPGRLPQDEEILWQGAPAWRALARRTFHVRSIAIYFVLIMVARAVVALTIEGATFWAAVGSALLVVPLGITAIALLVGIAAWHARTTVYTITNRRVVMRFGIAVELAVNLPFQEIGGAAILKLRDGHGDIPLSLTGTARLAYLHMWPHVRPARFSKTEPMLRCVPKAAEVARILTEAWTADAERRGVKTTTELDVRPAARAVVAHVPAEAMG